MRPENGARAWMLWTGALFLSAILAASAGWASQQDVQGQQTAKTAGAAKQPAAETETPKADKKNDDDEDADSKGKEAVAGPGFNTIEDIVAYRGSVASLWAKRSEVKPAVTWCEATAPDQDPEE